MLLSFNGHQVPTNDDIVVACIKRLVLVFHIALETSVNAFHWPARALRTQFGWGTDYVQESALHISAVQAPLLRWLSIIILGHVLVGPKDGGAAGVGHFWEKLK